MKSAVIMFLVALALSALFSPYGMMSAYPTRAGFQNIEEGAASGMKRRDVIIPEINVVDGYRHQHYMTQVIDTDDQEQAEFPMQALQ